MTQSTPNLSLVLYNSTTDQSATFAAYRADQSGISGTSNMSLIDTAVGALKTRVDNLEALKSAIQVNGSFISSNYYEATVALISAYSTGMSILLKLDTDSAGTVTLKINALATISVMKVDATGTPVNMAAGELQSGRYYLFIYDGTRWVWADSTSGDQVYVSGTVGNNVKIASDNSLVDAGTAIVVPEAFSLTGDISPSQITSNQNDYAPTGFATASTLRLTTDATRNITGLAGGADGRIIVIANVGSFPMILTNEDSNSTASNRFILFSDTTINSNQDVIIQYDSTSSRWRLIGGTGSGAINRSWFGV